MISHVILAYKVKKSVNVTLILAIRVGPID